MYLFPAGDSHCVLFVSFCVPRAWLGLGESILSGVSAAGECALLGLRLQVEGPRSIIDQAEMWEPGRPVCGGCPPGHCRLPGDWPICPHRLAGSQTACDLSFSFSLEVTLGHESGLFYTLLEDTFYLSPGLNHKKAYQIGGHIFFL